jgi:hypothetical protein
MSENDSIAKIKDDVEEYGKKIGAKTWFGFEEIDKLPSECETMFVAERPSTGKGDKDEFKKTFSGQRFDLFQKLRNDFFPNSSYATDCIKTCPINSWKDGPKRKRENEKDFEEQKEYLRREIDCVKPSVIVPLGNEAERLIKKCVNEWEEFERITLSDKIWHYSYRFEKDFTRKYEKKFQDLSHVVQKALRKMKVRNLKSA